MIDLYEFFEFIEKCKKDKIDYTIRFQRNNQLSDQPERSKREDLMECVLCNKMHDNESKKETCENCHYKIVKKIHQDAVL